MSSIHPHTGSAVPKWFQPRSLVGVGLLILSWGVIATIAALAMG